MAPKLTLKKVVVNANGSTSTIADWTLTATGPVTKSGKTGDAAITAAAVSVGTYNLTESGVPGYTASNWVCTGAASSTASSVTLALSNDATCTITNTAIAPTLKLIKVVDANGSGTTTAATAWTLTATGQGGASGVNLSGVTGVNGAVNVGTYNLGETGPTGFTASNWVCTGASASTATSVSVALGGNAVCTITKHSCSTEVDVEEGRRQRKRVDVGHRRLDAHGGRPGDEVG